MIKANGMEFEVSTNLHLSSTKQNRQKLGCMNSPPRLEACGMRGHETALQRARKRLVNLAKQDPTRKLARAGMNFPQPRTSLFGKLTAVAIYLGTRQSSQKWLVRGCEKFIPALAYLFCLALPGSCLARFTNLFCTLSPRNDHDTIP